MVCEFFTLNFSKTPSRLLKCINLRLWFYGHEFIASRIFGPREKVFASLYLFGIAGDYRNRKY